MDEKTQTKPLNRQVNNLASTNLSNQQAPVRQARKKLYPYTIHVDKDSFMYNAYTGERIPGFNVKTKNGAIHFDQGSSFTVHKDGSISFNANNVKASSIKKTPLPFDHRINRSFEDMIDRNFDEKMIAKGEPMPIDSKMAVMRDQQKKQMHAQIKQNYQQKGSGFKPTVDFLNRVGMPPELADKLDKERNAKQSTAMPGIPPAQNKNDELEL